ncbi:sigma-like protein [Streptomyces sp. NPDC002328]|uniref:sigma-like protein n=1 Tax=Streptomyces sp. NPDC002328 TaxID=3364642 RepID=UPI00368C5004
MSQAEKNDDVVKPLDNHASVVEEGVLAAAAAGKKPAAEPEITTMDNHASGGKPAVLDNHASDETA